MKGEEISKAAGGRAFVRSGTFSTEGEVFLNIAGDKSDGLGEPGRSGVIVNTSTGSDPIFFQFSPDGHNFSGDFALTLHVREFRFYYDDGISVSGLVLRGPSGSSYSVAVFPGRSPEGQVQSPPNVIPEPGPTRKLGRGKVI